MACGAVIAMGCGDDEPEEPGGSLNVEEPDEEWSLEVEISQLSVDVEGERVSGESRQPAISRDGEYVSFSTTGGWVSGSLNGMRDIFGRQVDDPQSLELISVDDDGQAATEGGLGSAEPAMSADGSEVVFSSSAHLNINDPIAQIYVRDRLEPSTVLISRDESGVPARAPVEEPSISDDGRWVTLTSSWALVSDRGDHGLRTQVYLYDRASQEMRRVSTNVDGEPARDGEAPVIQSQRAAVSGDGRYVVFESNAMDLVEEPVSGRTQIYRYDIEESTLEWISRRGDGSAGDGNARRPSISANGEVIAFSSEVNLVDPEVSGTHHLFPRLYIYDAEEAEFERVGDGNTIDRVRTSSLSEDGRFIAFEADVAAGRQIYWYDRQEGRLQRLSESSSGDAANGESVSPSISGDGQRVVWASEATNLGDGQTLEQWDIFMASLHPSGD